MSTSTSISLSSTQTCSKCNSIRIALVVGRVKDQCFQAIRGKWYEGYPSLDNISAGDNLDFAFCLDCGQIQGRFPVSLTWLEGAEEE